jgi:two-component system, NarL family, sensor histidine kinase UhpB
MIRALLIEDSEDDAMLVLRELKRGGLEVQSHRVDTAPELEDALARGGWDVVLSDYMMPAFSGLHALTIVRAVDTDLPFIIVSGAVGEEVAVDAMKAGAHDYVMKSNLVRLVQAVRREIAESESRRRRKQVERQLVESEERLQLVVKATRDAVWDWNPVTGSSWVNQTFRDFLGVPADANDIRAWWATRLHPDDSERVLGYFFAGDGPRTSEEIEYRVRRADGAYAHVLDRWFVVLDKTQRPVRLIGAIMDLTERKRIETELKDVNLRLKHLSARIMSVQEDERRSIAHELHDDVGQVLTALKISLETLERSGGGGNVGISLAELSDMANRALARVRDLTLALRPPQLDDLGLTAALRWHLDQQSRVCGWQGVFEADALPGRLSPDMETACFRVAQEALTNAARHQRRIGRHRGTGATGRWQAGHRVGAGRGHPADRGAADGCGTGIGGLSR